MARLGIKPMTPLLQSIEVWLSINCLKWTNPRSEASWTKQELAGACCTDVRLYTFQIKVDNRTTSAHDHSHCWTRLRFNILPVSQIFLTTCMPDNVWKKKIIVSWFFSKLRFSNKFYQEYFQSTVKQFGSRSGPTFGRAWLDPNCLQRLSAIALKSNCLDISTCPFMLTRTVIRPIIISLSFWLCLHRYWNTFLTLKAPITTAADDKFWDIFPNFRQK